MVQLQTVDNVFVTGLTGDGATREWCGKVSWTGDALLRVAALRYHEDAEGYHSLANYHLHNAAASPATLERVSVSSSGRIEVVARAEALDAPRETAKRLQATRRDALRKMEDGIPALLRRIVMNDGMMHTRLQRHHDALGQPLPASFGLPTMPAMRLATAQRILEQMAGVAGDCLADDADDATLVAVGLAAHAGQWSKEQFDDRELTMMLGEDCDDMVIRARGVFCALKRHLPNLKRRCGCCRRICNFIEGHRMLSCQGHASPPHPGVTVGQIIGHVFGLFVNDVDWRSELGLRSGVPVSVSNHDFVKLLNPMLCEATAACRATPPPLGTSWKKCPEVVEIRTTPGDESYLSVQQAQEDDCVVYFFQNDQHGRPVGGIRAEELLRAEGTVRPPATFQVLMMQSDPSEKTATDAVTLLHEADREDLQSLYEDYCSMMKAEGFAVPRRASRARPRVVSAYHTSAQFCTGATFCNLKY